jgi:Domain of unknown function (DUF4377)
MRLNVHAILLVSMIALSGCTNSNVQKIVYVAPVTVKCTIGVEGAYIPSDPSLATFDCLQIREALDQSWGFTEGIQGFTFESGFTYKLSVLKIYPPPGLADAFPTLKLVGILEKRPVSN